MEEQSTQLKVTQGRKSLCTLWSSSWGIHSSSSQGSCVSLVFSRILHRFLHFLSKMHPHTFLSKRRHEALKHLFLNWIGLGTFLRIGELKLSLSWRYPKTCQCQTWKYYLLLINSGVEGICFFFQGFSLVMHLTHFVLRCEAHSQISGVWKEGVWGFL